MRIWLTGTGLAAWDGEGAGLDSRRERMGAKGSLVSCSYLDGEHESELAHRSVLEARGLRRAEAFFGDAAQRASWGETEKVADLFGNLRVNVGKMRLQGRFNIKKFLRMAMRKVAACA